MPELPEVETVRRDLQRRLVGRTIRAASIVQPDILRRTGPVQLVNTLVGSEVVSAERRGKNLVIRLEREVALLVNLGMTGQLVVGAADHRAEAHTHLIAALSDGGVLAYRDVRRFGHLELAPFDRLEESFTLRNVGVDALSPEHTPERLHEAMSGRTALLKGALLDQSMIAGLGNIYVCEAMFRAGLSPRARCRDLSREDVVRLHDAIRAVLTESIAAEGTTISDYVTGAGVPGGFQERLRVYGREGQVCTTAGCEHRIERIVQSNRSTFYCPGCQANPPGME